MDKWNKNDIDYINTATIIRDWSFIEFGRMEQKTQPTKNPNLPLIDVNKL